MAAFTCVLLTVLRQQQNVALTALTDLPDDSEDKHTMLLAV